MEYAVILERAYSLATEYMYSISLQRRRVEIIEPEDDEFIMRRWVDIQFLISGLVRLRKCVLIASQVPEAKIAISQAVEEFDKRLPALQNLRNVVEHIDEYAIDQGRNKSMSRGQVQVGSIIGAELNWLGPRLDLDEAKSAAEQLYSDLLRIIRSLQV